MFLVEAGRGRPRSGGPRREGPGRPRERRSGSQGASLLLAGGAGRISTLRPLRQLRTLLELIDDHIEKRLVPLARVEAGEVHTQNSDLVDTELIEDESEAQVLHQSRVVDH